MSVCIVAVEYEEPEYTETRAAIENTGQDVVWVDRDGIGSLARAYNEGFREAQRRGAGMVWFLSNITFGPDVLPRLVGSLAENPEYAAIQPPYDSDHAFLRPNGSGKVESVPYVEFTCPLVRANVFARFPLDERMPYWGHDLDWGFRVRQAGWKVGVDQGCESIGHTYIRHVQNPLPVTKKRHALRHASNRATRKALIRKYGNNWAQVLGYDG